MRVGREHFALASCLALASSSCSFDSEAEAPYQAPAAQPGPCGTTETLFPKLLTFVRSGGFEPLREVIETRLVPSEEQPRPDPSLRSTLDAVITVVKALGLADTVKTASTAASSQTLQELTPLLTRALRFVSGELDGQDHYDASDALGTMVQMCNPDHLLLALEQLLRFRSPSHGGELWLLALFDETVPLLQDPFFEPFLSSFERESQQGRPAIISLVDQILMFIADDDFHISRVETLLESAVYPLVTEDLRTRIEVLVVLLGEATDREAGILEPLQRAVRCGIQHPAARREIVGLLYDFVQSDALELDELLASANQIASTAAREKLHLTIADVFAAIRADPDARDELRDVLAMFLKRPQIEKITPVVTQLLDQGVLVELLDAVALLIGGCDGS